MGYNKKLLYSISGLGLLLVLRLLITADSTNNWRGFAYSTFHLIAIGVAAYFVLKNHPHKDSQD